MESSRLEENFIIIREGLHSLSASLGTNDTLYTNQNPKLLDYIWENTVNNNRPTSSYSLDLFKQCQVEFRDNYEKIPSFIGLFLAQNNDNNFGAVLDASFQVDNHEPFFVFRQERDTELNNLLTLVDERIPCVCHCMIGLYLSYLSSREYEYALSVMPLTSLPRRAFISSNCRDSLPGSIYGFLPNGSYFTKELSVNDILIEYNLNSVREGTFVDSIEERKLDVVNIRNHALTCYSCLDFMDVTKRESNDVKLLLAEAEKLIRIFVAKRPIMDVKEWPLPESMNQLSSHQSSARNKGCLQEQIQNGKLELNCKIILTNILTDNRFCKVFESHFHRMYTSKERNELVLVPSLPDHFTELDDNSHGGSCVISLEFYICVCSLVIIASVMH